MAILRVDQGRAPTPRQKSAEGALSVVVKSAGFAEVYA